MPEPLAVMEPKLRLVWTHVLVKQRLVEAFAVERRMPAEKRVGHLASSWPAEVLHTFSDQVYWTESTARQRVWDSWAHAKGAAPIEVSRMYEAYDWLTWIEEGQRNCLKRWAVCKAFNRSETAMLRVFKVAPRTFYRKVNQGSLRIAELLNRRAVQVR